MHKTSILINTLLFLFLANSPAIAAQQQNTKPTNLVKEIFSPAKILGVEFFRKDISGYSTIDLEGVQSAKNALSRFFIYIQTQNDAALTFLTEDLEAKYKSPREIYKYLAGDSEGIIEFKIFDFDYLQNKKLLSIRYDLTTTTEGTICINQHSVVMQYIAGRWKIQSLH